MKKNIITLAFIRSNELDRLYPRDRATKFYGNI